MWVWFTQINLQDSIQQPTTDFCKPHRDPSRGCYFKPDWCLTGSSAVILHIMNDSLPAEHPLWVGAPSCTETIAPIERTSPMGEMDRWGRGSVCRTGAGTLASRHTLLYNDYIPEELYQVPPNTKRHHMSSTGTVHNHICCLIKEKGQRIPDMWKRTTSCHLEGLIKGVKLSTQVIA